MNFPVELDDWIENQKASEDGCDMYGLQPFPPVPGGGLLGNSLRGPSSSLVQLQSC